MKCRSCTWGKVYMNENDCCGSCLEPTKDTLYANDQTFDEQYDGEAFDADDVRFTYEAIMATRNLSPRRASFEPIKTFEVLDPHNVRIVYKRLYAPALLSWAIGMLPEHLLNASRMEAEMEARSLSDDARACPLI